MSVSMKYSLNSIPVLKKCIRNVRVEIISPSLYYDVIAFIKLHCISVASLCGYGIKHICYRHYPCTERNILTCKSIRVSPAVPLYERTMKDSTCVLHH